MDKKQELQKYQEAAKWVEKLKPQMAMALPKAITPERMARVALTQMRMTPKLLQCDAQSLMKCLMISAQLGLEPGSLGHAYFIPYGREAQFIIGYKGMIELIMRSGKVKSISARVVREGEKCEIRYGTNPGIEHSPSLTEMGKPIGYYAVAQFRDGGEQFDFMNMSEIAKVREKSKSGNSGPWVSHFDEMAKKSVIRRLFKYLPVSIEVQQAVSLDEHADIGKQREIIDSEFFEIDTETGEVFDKPEGDKLSQADAIADKLTK